MKTLDRGSELAVAIVLVALMVATRFHHFGSALHLPDASWAIFFVGGFYLRRTSIMAVFIALAGLIDYFAITQLGTSAYCITPAYAFLVPTYAVLWFGGVWFSGAYKPRLSSLLPLVLSVVVSTVAAFVISNVAFYLLGDQFADMSATEYASRVGGYLGGFLSSTLGYVAVAALVHWVIIAAVSSKQAGGTDSHS
ncbi:MAG: hypothetical protein ACWA5X_03300 [bacterium]